MFSLPGGLFHSLSCFVFFDVWTVLIIVTHAIYVDRPNIGYTYSRHLYIVNESANKHTIGNTNISQVSSRWSDIHSSLKKSDQVFRKGEHVLLRARHQFIPVGETFGSLITCNPGEQSGNPTYQSRHTAFVNIYTVFCFKRDSNKSCLLCNLWVGTVLIVVNFPVSKRIILPVSDRISCLQISLCQTLPFRCFTF